VGDEVRRPQRGSTGVEGPADGPEGVPSAASGWFRILRLVLGGALVVLGIVGLFVPVLQGVLLISLGLLILSRESPALQRLGRRLGKRFPFLNRWHDQIQRRRGSWSRRRKKTGGEHGGEHGGEGTESPEEGGGE